MNKESLRNWVSGKLISNKKKNELNRIFPNINNKKDKINELAKYFNLKESPAFGHENIPEEGSLLIVANHRFGLKDGIKILLEVFEKRPDTKVLVKSDFKNFGIEGLEDIFLFINNEKLGRNRLGFSEENKVIEEYLNKGESLIMFPEAVVEKEQDKQGNVTMEDFKSRFVKLAKKTNANILPVAVDGKLEKSFYSLAKFSSFLAKLRILAVNFKHEGEVPIQILPQFTAEEIEEEIENLKHKGLSMTDRLNFYAKKVQKRIENYLNKTYLEDKSVTSKNMGNSQDFYLIPPHKKFSGSNFCKELTIQRGRTFKKVQEATEKELKGETDKLDNQFFQAVVLDNEIGIASSYRLQPLNNIPMKESYNDELFEFSDYFKKNIQPQAIELGRSFLNIDATGRKGLHTFGNMFKGLHKSIQYFNEETKTPAKYLMGSLSFSKEIEPEELRRKIISAYQNKFKSPESLAKAKNEKNLIEKKNVEESFEELLQQIPRDKRHLVTLPKHYSELVESGGFMVGPAVENPDRNCDEVLIVLDLSKIHPKKDKAYGNNEYSIRNYWENKE